MDHSLISRSLQHMIHDSESMSCKVTAQVSERVIATNNKVCSDVAIILWTCLSLKLAAKTTFDRHNAVILKSMRRQTKLNQSDNNSNILDISSAILLTSSNNNKQQQHQQPQQQHQRYAVDKQGLYRNLEKIYKPIHEKT